jgi:copper chaperone CopZ
MPDMAATTYEVSGMTCDHCVRAVTSEISEVEGVTSVDVRLAEGTAAVHGDADPEAVRAAVVEAGYEVVGIRS